MLESIIILLTIISILFFLLMIYWNSLTIGTMDIMLWFITGTGFYHYEIPYTLVGTNNTILQGTQVIETLYPISYFYIGMALITLLYMLTYIIFPILRGKYSRMM